MRTLVVLPLLLFALLPLAAQTIADGDRAFAAFDYDRAAAVYAQVVRSSPSPEVYTKLWAALFHKAHSVPEDRRCSWLSKARNVLEEANKRYPNTAGLYARLALTVGDMGRSAPTDDKAELIEAMRVYTEKALALDENEPLANAAAGLLHYRISSLNWAERALATTLYGSLPTTSMEESRRYLERAVRGAPSVVFFRYALARTLIELDDEAEAGRHLRQGLQLPVTTRADMDYKALMRDMLDDLE